MNWRSYTSRKQRDRISDRFSVEKQNSLLPALNIVKDSVYHSGDTGITMSFNQRERLDYYLDMITLHGPCTSAELAAYVAEEPIIGVVSEQQVTQGKRRKWEKS